MYERSIAVWSGLGTTAVVALIGAASMARANAIVPPEPKPFVRIAIATPVQEIDPWELPESAIMFGVQSPRPSIDRAWERSLPRVTPRKPAARSIRQSNASAFTFTTDAAPFATDADPSTAPTAARGPVVPEGTFTTDWFQRAFRSRDVAETGASAETTTPTRVDRQ
ncbi:MAG: hypothetical protein AAFZ05_06695 [Pseudomonadota bacterium]